MRTFALILAWALLHGVVFAQFPPILRQSLTTNTANNPTAAGQTPVWNGTTWTMLSTNATGGGGNDNLWTNTTIEYLPIRTNTFGFAKEAGGLWLGSNSPTFWGALGASDSLVSVRNAVAGESPNNNFYFFVRGAATNTTSVEGAMTGASSMLTVLSTNDLINSTYVQAVSQVDGQAYLVLVTNLITRVQIAASGDSYLNGAGAKLGIGNAAPSAPLHVTGTSFLQGGITNWAGHQHTNGAFVGAIFQSSTASGDAVWSTNVPSLVVTNLYVTNINGVGASAITNLYWTNDAVVLKPTPAGLEGRSAFRWGTNSNSTFGDSTNVGFFSFAAGSNNIAKAHGSVVFGQNGEIRTNADWSTIGGGRRNIIESNLYNSVIAGGGLNRIGGLGAFQSFIGGGSNNQINLPSAGDIGFAVIVGGADNVAISNYSAVVGGVGNTADARGSFIGGGENNQVDFKGFDGVVGGGQGNLTRSRYGFVGGGVGNKVGFTDSAIMPGNTIVGGVTNIIAVAGSSTTSNSFIGGGRLNSIQQTDVSHGVIGGGDYNLLGGNSTNAFIGGGHANTINAAHVGAIMAGKLNVIDTLGDFGFIPGGHSNYVNASFAGVAGTRGSNTLAYSFDIAPNGNISKSTFTATNTILRTSLATAPDAVVDLTADNQVVDATQRSHVRLSSNDGTAGNRTFILTGTNVTAGALLVLEWTDTDAGEVVDDAACSGAGNHRLSATWTPTQYDTLSLIFNGTDWVERGRSTN